MLTLTKLKKKTLLVFYWGRVIIGCQKLTAWWGNGVETHLDKKRRRRRKFQKTAGWYVKITFCDNFYNNVGWVTKRISSWNWKLWPFRNRAEICLISTGPSPFHKGGGISLCIGSCKNIKHSHWMAIINYLLPICLWTHS